MPFICQISKHKAKIKKKNVNALNWGRYAEIGTSAILVGR